MNSILDDNTSNIRLFILDPLSVIIKLAIISNKPVGTKLNIVNNVVYLQEPGIFQGISRFINKSNRTDLHYLYNPIEIACKQYLNKTAIQQNPKIKDLFKCAQNGLNRLIDTYKLCSIIKTCLNYYLSLIANHLYEINNSELFKKDELTDLYTSENLDKLTKMWTQDKIKIVLNLTTFLSNDEYAEINVKSLETIMDGIDIQVHKLLN